MLLREFGGPEVLQLVEDHPRPARRPGEVLVEVHCSSVNPIDCKARAGELTRLLCPLPRVSAAGLCLACRWFRSCARHLAVHAHWCLAHLLAHAGTGPGLCRGGGRGGRRQHAAAWHPGVGLH